MGAQEPWLCQRVLSWWTLKQRMSRLHSLSRGTITNAVFPGERTKHGTVLRVFFFLQANRRVSVIQLATWGQHQNTLSGSHGIKAIVLNHGLCCWQAVTIRVSFSSMSVCQTTEVSIPFSHAEPRCTQTDDHSGSWAADSTILRLLPTFVSLTIRLQADRRARFSHCVKRLCQMCSPSKCTGGPSWSQSSPINDGPISSSRDLWAGKWKAWRCSHLYNQCQGASDMDTPRLPAPHQPLWSDGDA